MEEEIYANAELDKPDNRGGSMKQLRFRSSKRFCEPVVSFLGLLSVLLLAGLIGFSVHCHSSARKLSATEERLQACDAQLSSMSEERNLLNVSLANTAEQLRCLKKTCPSGWTRFGCSCYFFSYQKKSWALSRKDCIDNGADLVVINSLEEQEFISNATKIASWIGLSDADNEGTWKWTDGTPLTLSFWLQRQPDNGGGNPRYGEEDCATAHSLGIKVEENWNDVSCQYFISYVCEN